MKLLFCALGIYSSPGGMQRFDQRVIRCLREIPSLSSSEVVVLVLWDRREDANAVPWGVEFLPCSRSKVYMVLQFVWHLLVKRPELILYDHVLLAPLAVLARLLLPRTRQMLFAYGDEVWRRPAFWRRLIVRKFIDLIAVISKFTAETMAQSFDLAAGQLELLPCAVDLSSAERSAVPRANAIDGEYRLLTVSRLAWAEREKGHDKVILALRTVLSVFPNTHYYVAGDGPLKEELRRLAEQAGVASNVHLLGYVDEAALDALYAHSHVFVMPSKKEGFGIVYLEAWKHGLPVIAGNRDAGGEVATHGVTGLLVDPENIEEISQAILTLLSDSESRVAMGCRGQQEVTQKYCHERFRGNLGRILTKVSDGLQHSQA